MKITIQILLGLGLLCTGGTRALAQLNVPSDGSDGALNIISNTVIDLSLATTNHDWTYNNSGNAGNGVYDASKWAVVFKYSSVNIASNAIVTFLNHPSHAPVVWLVQSNVTISGNVNVNGHDINGNYPDYLLPNEPGPGGFRGGAISPSGRGGGYGPGASQANLNGSASSYGDGYGNPQVLPLLGGSGGGAFDYGGQRSGPAGGGAILIAAGTVVTINGQVTALAGSGFSTGGIAPNYVYAGNGAIRIIANYLLGNGILYAGRVRTEVNQISSQLAITPNTVAVPPGATPVIWPSVSAPVIAVVSVNAAPAPADPQGQVLTSSDVNVSTNGPVDIIVQSQNFPPSGSIVVRVTPKYDNYFNVNATYQSGTFASALWKATTTLPNGFCVLQAHATSP